MLSDTHPDAEAMWIGLLRTATIEQRLTRMVQLTQMVRDMARQAIAQARPELSPREQDLLFVEVTYGLEWAGCLRDYQALRETSCNSIS
jgi:hypothetical protein